MKTLVIVPGWGGSYETWAGFIALARERFEVVCIDLPGFGGVPAPETVWGVTDYANYLAQKIRELGKPANEVVLLAHSFGGQVSVRMLGEGASGVGRVVFTAPAVFRRKPGIKQIVFGRIAKIGKVFFSLPGLSRFERVSKKVLYRMADSPDYNNTSGMMRQIFQTVTREDVSDLLSHISIPTLIVWGARDRYVPVDDGRKMTEKIPGARLEIIPDATHGIHLSHTQKLLDLVTEFSQ